mgnify:CR=1 FL=1
MGKTVKEIAWLAGLLEGEGCFSFSGKPRIQLIMTDRDTVEWAATLMNVRCTGPYARKQPNRLVVYQTIACGRRAAGWMMTVLPLLGSRRAKKVVEVLREYKSRPTHPSTPYRYG